MTTTPTRPVLVGVDGLPGSSGAVRYAVVEARRRQAPLQLVHVIPDFLSPGPPVPLPDLDRIGVDILEREARSVRQMARDLTVTTALVHGERSTGLVRAAEPAQLLVIGRETRHGIERFYTGTVTASVAAHAPCDVVVVPSFWVDDHPHRTVVVGLKNGRHCAELLSQAFSEAAEREARLSAAGICEAQACQLARESAQGWRPPKGQVRASPPKSCAMPSPSWRSTRRDWRVPPSERT